MQPLNRQTTPGLTFAAHARREQLNRVQNLHILSGAVTPSLSRPRMNSGMWFPRLRANRKRSMRAFRNRVFRRSDASQAGRKSAPTIGPSGALMDPARSNGYDPARLPSVAYRRRLRSAQWPSWVHSEPCRGTRVPENHAAEAPCTERPCRFPHTSKRGNGKNKAPLSFDQPRRCGSPFDQSSVPWGSLEGPTPVSRETLQSDEPSVEVCCTTMAEGVSRETQRSRPIGRSGT